MKNIKIALVTICLLLISNLSLAQVEQKSNDELVKSMVENLKQKILLNDDQASKVSSILNVYVSNKNATDSDFQNLESKIESLLDNKQKMKFNILKKDWFKSLKPVSVE